MKIKDLIILGINPIFLILTVKILYYLPLIVSNPLNQSCSDNNRIFMNKAFYLKKIIILLAAGSLSGCLATPFIRGITGIFKTNDEDNAAGSRFTNIEILPLKIPKNGDHIVIHDPKTDTKYTVTIGQVYTAASGKMCGRYTLKREDSPSQSGLVCFEKQDQWVKVPLQIPLNN